MARKQPRHTDKIATTPFDVRAWIQQQDEVHPGFAAAVDAELASLHLEERLRELRRSRNLTQAQLAKRMGVTQSAIAQMEQAEPGGMEVRTLARMATALGYGLRIDFQPQDATVTSPRNGRRNARKPTKARSRRRQVAST